MSEIKDKLNQLLARKGVMTGAEWLRQKVEEEQLRESGAYEIDKITSGAICSNESGSFFLVRHEFPNETMHGNLPLRSALDVIPEHIALISSDSGLAEFNAATSVFLDTETSGISGGAGTIAFLVGVGYFVGNVFRLDQCFLRDFDDEEGMLRHLDEIFKSKETVVTYNGKSFDAPLLRSRFIQYRMPFRLDSALHLDLLHAARRFWKRRLKDCSLGNVERSILGIERHNDVPSFEIPQLWLDYLRTRDARKLDRVFTHHRLDVLSLVTLAGWLSWTLDESRSPGFQHAEDRLSSIELHHRQKRYDEVVTAVDALLESSPDPEIAYAATELKGFALKRLKEFEQMQQCWEIALREFPSKLIPRIELAKHYEHRMRDLVAAERVCTETISIIDSRANTLGDVSIESWYADSFRYRLARLRRKLTNINGAAADFPEPPADDQGDFWDEDASDSGDDVSRKNPE